MKISPLDIKKQEFARKFKGYSEDEVHSYLEMVADELEEALRLNRELEQKVVSLEEKLSHYTKIENVLQDTLLTTQKSAEETKSSAEQKGKAMLDEAQTRSDSMVAEAREMLLVIRREIADLKHQRDSFMVQFKSMLETQGSLMEIIEKRWDSKGDYQPVRMKADLDDGELEEIVNEFENRLQPKDNNDNSGTAAEEDNQ